MNIEVIQHYVPTNRNAATRLQLDVPIDSLLKAQVLTLLFRDQIAKRAGLRRTFFKVEILIIAAMGDGAAPTAIETFQFPGVDLQLAVVERVKFARQRTVAKRLTLRALLDGGSSGVHVSVPRFARTRPGHFFR